MAVGSAPTFAHYRLVDGLLELRKVTGPSDLPQNVTGRRFPPLVRVIRDPSHVDERGNGRLHGSFDPAPPGGMLEAMNLPWPLLSDASPELVRGSNPQGNPM